MGKTNLLDAVYFTCMTKSNFTSQDRNLVLMGEDFLRTDALISDSKIVCKYEKGKKKVFEINKKAYTKLSDHIGKFPVVFIAPNDQNLLLEGSIERRKLLDNTISQLDQKYLLSLIRYNTLLNQRNAYLKLVAKSGGYNQEMALTYTQQMLEPCQYIFTKRSDFIREFSDSFAKKYGVISNGQEVASCNYKSQLVDGDFLELTKENIQKDRILNRTSIGIHKDDLVFKMDDKAVKYFASQGQTKSFVLSIKLAQYEIIAQVKNVKPILLLDDLFDKLDHRRVQHLISLLESEKVEQVFISDTDPDRIINILEEMNVEYNKIVINNGSQQDEKDAGEEE
ncbi:DNA replication and repair protein RecF [Portibacter lacus]|uniref:DNA replication and repair protein RecF n=2 Tax=Portibacter lacus TaxID=1099794 RepID=A0AA37WC99_9BACT|nr:DNA replication and repair protein RecF [Portibacter lacus]